jgi:hypothetical protein
LEAGDAAIPGFFLTTALVFDIKRREPGLLALLSAAPKTAPTIQVRFPFDEIELS